MLKIMKGTLDVDAELARKARGPWNDDVAEIATRVGLLCVVDEDGQVGGGHGEGKAHSTSEFWTPNSDLARAVRDDLKSRVMWGYSISIHAMAKRCYFKVDA